MTHLVIQYFLAVSFVLTPFSLTSQDQRPNIIMIVVDDMRFDEWSGGGHTFLKTPAIDQLASEGTVFKRAYHAVPLCSPNRASILTGQYPSRHGIIDNTARNQVSFMLDLFPKYLQEAGYRTGHIGKWHMGNSPDPRPGYDYWLCLEGQGTTMNPTLYDGNKRMEYEGYITDIFTDKSIDFISDSKAQPFFLYIGHKAIHPEVIQRDDGTSDLSMPKKFIAAKRHRGHYNGAIAKRSPAHHPTGQSDLNKPVILAAFKNRDKAMREDPRWTNVLDLGVSDKTIQDRAEMMLAVDESLARILAALTKNKIDKQTVIIFTSDNGYFFGEHGFSLERRMPYEESVKAPLIIKCPMIEDPVPHVSSISLSIDLSATALDFAGIDMPPSIQGKSLIPLIEEPDKKVRSHGFVEYFSHENPFPWTAQLDYRIVISNRYKYIKWLRFNEAELYDLEDDPFEQNNLIHSVQHQNIIAEMKVKMEDLQLKAMELR